MEARIPKNWAVRFFTIFAGQAFSLFGSSLVQFALVWYLTQKNRLGNHTGNGYTVRDAAANPSWSHRRDSG